jgi:hypothetical protein
MSLEQLTILNEITGPSQLVYSTNYIYTYSTTVSVHSSELRVPMRTTEEKAYSTLSTLWCTVYDHSPWAPLADSRLLLGGQDPLRGSWPLVYSSPGSLADSRLWMTPLELWLAANLHFYFRSSGS